MDNWLTIFAANKVGATARTLGLVALLYAITAAAPVISPAAVHANPGAPVQRVGRATEMYGEPAFAAAYWREQHASDCGEMAVADVVGQVTGRQPTEQQIIDVAENSSSTVGPGPIWKPAGFTDIRDLPILLWHYGIKADNVQSDIDALKQKLRDGHKIIAILNAETIWNRSRKRNAGNHFVVVTGIDTRSGVVHLNDSAIDTGRDEKVPIATFEQAWAPNFHSAIVTQ
ncbi:C39 family peptidase [Mycobacterium sp.]|uniref:C39 family peptidase n=1 Tax=Mycobacterium sp. TaxID=1785 RepID=UPI003D10F95E